MCVSNEKAVEHAFEVLLSLSALHKKCIICGNCHLATYTKCNVDGT